MNPIQAFVNTYSSGYAAGQSTYVTGSFAITQEFEAFVPVRVISPTTWSADAVVRIYRHTAGSAGAETEGTVKSVISAIGSAADNTKDITLGTGQYTISVMVGGGHASLTASIAIASTAMVITAYS